MTARAQAAGTTAVVTALTLVLGGVLGGVVGGVLQSARASYVGAGRDLAPAASRTCSDVLLVAVPGDGETPVRRAPDSAGPTLDVFGDAYRTAAAAGRRSVSTTVVPATTAPAEQLAGRSGRDRAAIDRVTRSALRSWRGRLGLTVKEVLTTIGDAAAACPDQQLVLAGYAQGAMAVHRALLALQAQPGVYDRVAAVALVSDGYRLPGAPRRSLVGSPRAPRAGRGISTVFNTPPAALPQTGSPVRVWQVCARGDLVCDISRTSLAAALSAHRSYTGASAGALADLGRQAFDRSSRWALPDPVEQAVDAQVGVPLQRRLDVRVREGDLPAVLWGDVVGLPAGLQLDAHGALTGVASRPGTFSVSYTVRNTTAPQFDRPVTGRLTVRVEDPSVVGGNVSAGGTQSCEVRRDGTAWCWGDNSYGQLGNGTRTSSAQPVQVGSANDWATISTSGSTTCGTRTDGRALCWGLNRWGQLGDGTRNSSSRPVEVAEPGPWRSVVTGWFYTCGVKLDGSAWCWGSNGVGQLGDGTRSLRVLPHRVAGPGPWNSVTVGGWHTCGVKQDGSAWCWGESRYGELAVAGAVVRSTPQQVGSATSWKQLDASWSSTCGLRANGTIWCWGKNDRGQLGDGSLRNQTQPVRVPGDQSYAQVSVGDTHTCGRTTEGAVWCWGYNGYGQLGNGTEIDSRSPVAVSGTYQTFDAGWEHACGVTLGGVTRCWGENVAGQLGDGTHTDRPAPTRTKAAG